ncbi:helix-turn-helix domain-containing protein [Streptomyces tropicalis]|uniref:Pyridoxamine 5'-phosphate oxidase family protein n=1 Tax=Streptomyces tropicalis TaxID=3034234 RepID=A0ABT6A3Z0_9ACTN|nr:pyridoxamine 5'-phosphate oxidase family protein [Streptomyces tropicalis]MDF3299121.1 pyridoxamine 5'-phosphate oxidase family protein [Streptomyces tropicalis]
MTDQALPPAHPAEETPLGDLGRRLARRRTDRGLTRAQAADRAGIAPGYLRYLEEHPGAAPAPGTLNRLATALDTTVAHLTGATADRPPGPGRAAPAPVLTELAPAECRALLGGHGVGRLAVPTVSGPVVVPVNYSVVDGAIVFRTAPDATPYQAVGCRVAFEVDRIDDAFSRGWSVLVRGHAHAVTDSAEVRRLVDRAYSPPWAGGRRDVWVRIDPLVVTGRRITA